MPYRKLNNLISNKINQPDEFEKKIIFFVNELNSESKLVTVMTSGSTGQPKSMKIEKEKMLHSAKMTCDFLNLKQDDTALLALPIEYISGKMMVVRAIERKLSIYITQPSLNPLEKLNFKIDFCALTPLQVENSLDKLKWIGQLIIGGAAISESLKRKINEQLNSETSAPTIFETYGMTETLSHIALKQIYPLEECFFTALDGIELSVDDDDCLKIFAPKLNNDILQTNDIVELLDNNRFKFIGRKDFVINSGGAKIHPEELEKLAKNFIDQELVFSSVKDDVFGKKLVLYIEDSDISPIEKVKIINKIRAISFEKPFHQPKEIIFIPKIPRTENGKINRRELMG